MKLLKYFLLFLLITIIGIAIFISTKPNTYNIKDTHLLKASPEAVFNTVNNLKTWENWGPWNKEDTTMVYTYTDKTVGKGASYSWKGMMNGAIKTTAIVPNKEIKQNLTLYTPAGERNPEVYWTFNKVDGGTETTWGMKGKHTFMDKLYYTFGSPISFEDSMHQMNNAGFNGLETFLKENTTTKNFKLGAVSIKELAKQQFIGFFHKTKISNGDFQKAFINSMPKAGMYAAKNGLKQEDYTLAAIYKKWDIDKDVAEFYVGLFLNKKLKPSNEMKSIEIPAGKATTISKFGYYGNGDLEAHNAMATYIKAHNLKRNDADFVWELYVNDPTKVKPIEVQTDIYYTVQ